MSRLRPRPSWAGRRHCSRARLAGRGERRRRCGRSRRLGDDGGEGRRRPLRVEARGFQLGFDRRPKAVELARAGPACVPKLGPRALERSRDLLFADQRDSILRTLSSFGSIAAVFELRG